MTTPARPAPPAGQPMKAIGGIRVSTELQKHGYGPDRQRAEIEREAEREGLEISEWIEEQVSGANHDRAAENAYYELARRTHGLNFIFSHPNRVGRHVEVTVGIARELHRLGATVWIAGLGNLRDRRNWKYYLRDALEAEEDYSNVVHQLVSGKRGKAIRGLWPHGAVPWGYELERDQRGRSTKPAPHPDIAPVIKRLVDLAEEYGESRSVQMMREEGHPAPTAAGWTRRTVANILKNERYTGRAVFQGITIEYPAIIPREQWQRIQTKRAARKRESGPRDTSLLWAGHVRCAGCGAAIGRDSHTSGGRKYVYYRCWLSRRGAAQREGRDPCTNTKNWPVQEADDLWWLYFADALTDPNVLTEISAPPPPAEVAPPSRRIAELEEAIARAWEPYAMGKVGESVAERIAAPFMAELERLRAEYAPQPLPLAPDHSALAQQFGVALAGAVGFEDKRELLRLLDVRLYVGPAGPERLSITIP